jgi:hypothetical protein
LQQSIYKTTAESGLFNVQGTGLQMGVGLNSIKQMTGVSLNHGEQTVHRFGESISAHLYYAPSLTASPFDGAAFPAGGEPNLGKLGYSIRAVSRTNLASLAGVYLGAEVGQYPGGSGSRFVRAILGFSLSPLAKKYAALPPQEAQASRQALELDRKELLAVVDTTPELVPEDRETGAFVNKGPFDFNDEITGDGCKYAQKYDSALANTPLRLVRKAYYTTNARGKNTIEYHDYLGFVGSPYVLRWAEPRSGKVDKTNPQSYLPDNDMLIMRYLSTSPAALQLLTQKMKAERPNMIYRAGHVVSAAGLVGMLIGWSQWSRGDDSAEPLMLGGLATIGVGWLISNRTRPKPFANQRIVDAYNKDLANRQ